MSLHRLFNPASVALVGASADAGKISGMMVDFLRRSAFGGRVYPVNPRYDEICGWRCYKSVEDLPETVDVLVVAVPVAAALQVLESAGRRGVPFAVLMTGGFGEGASGALGEQRLAQLREICRQTGLRIVGPNIVGMVNFRASLPLTFADWYGRDTGQRGGVAILTHSGSVGGLIFSSLQLNRIGVDYWIGTGNEVNLEIADFIDHLSDDADLHTIVCFMEGVLDGRRFMQAAEMVMAGAEVRVTRSGYTGEDGFELSVPSVAAGRLAERLLDQPEVKPAGLGARDSLRLEAGLPLYGHDIDELTSPVEAGLTWTIGKQRRIDWDFPGAAAIRDQLDHGAPRQRVGLLVEGRSPARAGCIVAAADGTAAGTVTSGTFAPTRAACIAMAYLRRDLIADGTEVVAMLRGKPVPARVVPLPFVPHRYSR